MNLSSSTSVSSEEQTQALIKHYQKALVIKPDSATIHQDIGNLYQSLFDFEQAVAYYLKAIELKSDLFPAYYRLKFILENTVWSNEYQKGEIIENGIRVLEKNIINQPHFFFAYVILGELYAQQGKIEKAKDCYQKASFAQIQRFYPHLSQHWDFTTKRQPDFLVIGLFKCGTTSFYRYLTQHPQVLPAVAKEIRYLSGDTANDLDYYLSHFPAVSHPNYFTGEATPRYFILPNIAQQIKDWFPGIKLILLLRNPIKRAISGFYHGNQFSYRYLNKSLNDIRRLDINFIREKIFEIKKMQKLSHFQWLKFLAKKSKQNLKINDEIAFHIAFSLYINYLPEWFEHFPKEQLLILKSEDLFTNPASTMKQAYNFLGLPDHPLNEYRNANRNSYPDISLSLYQQLTEFFQPYNQQLEDYLGRKFDWE